MEIRPTSSIENTNKAIKVAAGTTAAVGLIGAGIFAGNKTDAFVKAKTAIQNGRLNNVFKSVISKTSKFAGSVTDKAKNVFAGVKDKLPKLGLADKAKATFTPVKEFAERVSGNIVKFASTIADKVESKFNAIKFNPDSFKDVFKNIFKK